MVTFVTIFADAELFRSWNLKFLPLSASYIRYRGAAGQFTALSARNQSISIAAALGTSWRSSSSRFVTYRGRKKADASRVTARSTDAVNEAVDYRVAAGHEHDWLWSWLQL